MFGDGRGFTADLIVAGLISADRIEANSIKAEKLANDVGASISLEGNSVIIEVQNDVDVALSTADAAKSGLDSYKVSNQSTIAQLQNSIAAKVSTTEYNERNEAVNNRISAIEVREDAVESSVADLENGIGTHFIIEEDKIRITQDQEQNWEQQLTATDMSFVNKETGEVVASFGTGGGYADKLRSNEELSVGTTTDGWYDMTALPSGVADKWRNGDTPPAIRPLITEEPVNCYVDQTVVTPQISFSVTAENAASYQWYSKLVAEDETHWSVIAQGTTSTYTATYGMTAQIYEYRCQITGDNGEIVNTRSCRVYGIGNPEILSQPTPETTVSVGDYATVSIYAENATSYTWQHLENGSWVDDVTTTLPERTTQELSAMIKTYRCVANNSPGSVPSGTYTITWE